MSPSPAAGAASARAAGRGGGAGRLLARVAPRPGWGGSLDGARARGGVAAVAAAVSTPAAPPADADLAAGPAGVPSTTIAPQLGRHGQPGQGATMRRLDGSIGPEAGRPGLARRDPQSVPGPGREPPPPARAPASWTVARGESFW